MKWKSYLYVLLGSLLFISCYDEDKLTSSVEDGNVDRFEFPQGTNTWDETIQELYEKFGVTLIYKGVTSTDLNRSWINVTSNYSATELSDEEVEFTVNFLKNQVFAYLSPEVMHKIWRPYWFLLRDYYRGSTPIRSYFGGMDFWSTCLYWSRELFDEKEVAERYWATTCKLPETEAELFDERTKYLYEILQMAVAAGKITSSKEYEEGFDYSTPIHNRVNSTSSSYPPENYCYTRGFISSTTSKGMALNYKPSSLSSANGFKGTMTLVQANFFQYIHLGLYYSDEELDTAIPRSEFPFLRGKLDIVIKHLKNTYRIDLRAIQKGLSVS